MRRFIVMCAFALPLAAWAGLDEAIEAYTAGDYAKALVEFQALAGRLRQDRGAGENEAGKNCNGR